jgi:hypothetical protein
MIGERLESRRTPPWGALLLSAGGLGLVATGLGTGINGTVAGAVLPLTLAASLWFLGQERPLTATIRQDWLEIESSEEPILIPYEGIQNIKVGGRLADPATFSKSSCPIAVLHAGGLLRIRHL